MPERRPDPAYRCEDDARAALTAARPVTGPVTLSLRWRRSGGDGFLLASLPPVPAGPGADVRWLSLGADSTGESEDRHDSEIGGIVERGVGGEGGAGESGERDAGDGEGRLHRDLYRRRGDAGAIIRSRPVHATVLACLPAIQQAGIPAFHADVRLAGGDSIRCAADAPTGSAALSDHALAALQDRRACLLARRGLLVTAPTLPAAATLSAEIEALAQIYCQVLLLQRTADGLPR